MKKIFSLCLLLLSLDAAAQTEFDFSLSGHCSYYGEPMEEKIYGFSSSREAEDIIDAILLQVGLSNKNFRINAANVPNAAAIIHGSTRHILYSQSFISQINSATQSKWAAASILAHEIGHHLNGHTLESGGSRPALELEADEFSGFVLAKMGANLAEAQMAMNVLGSNAGSATHPAKKARLEAIAVGWNKAREGQNSSTLGGNPNSRDNPPLLRTTPSQTAQYVSKCLFSGDPVAYYVTNTNVIVSYTPSTNQMVVIGQKQPSTDPRYAWVFATKAKQYGVSNDGRIWGFNRWGQLLQVGVVTYP